MSDYTDILNPFRYRIQSLEASIAHWKGQYQIAVEMVQEKKHIMAEQAKEIERLRTELDPATESFIAWCRKDCTYAPLMHRLRCYEKELKSALGESTMRLGERQQEDSDAG